MPGEPFQVSTIEAHDAMVKFGSMPQILATWKETMRCSGGWMD